MGNLNGVEYVDLKLPSGTLWAKYNLGAKTSLSCGDFFAWGEIKPKKRYSSKTYKLCDNNLSMPGVKKYGLDDETHTRLELEDDAANVMLGNGWRMPTVYDFNELSDYTIEELKELGIGDDRTKIITFRSKEDPSRYIVIPFGGWKQDSMLRVPNNEFNLWTSDVRQIQNPQLSLLANRTSLNTRIRLDRCYKWYGANIRPVHDKIEPFFPIQPLLAPPR